MVERVRPKAKQFLGIDPDKIPDPKATKVARIRPKEYEFQAEGKESKALTVVKPTDPKAIKAKERAAQERATQHRKRLFITAFLKNPNATKAAILAGYDPANAPKQGSDLLKIPYVKERIEQARAQAEQNAQVTLEKVLLELAKIGMANMQDYVSINAYGEPNIDLSELSPEQWAAVSEVNTEIEMRGHGDDAYPVKKVKIKLHPKNDALDKIARLLGGYVGKGGGPSGEELGQTTNYTLQIGNVNIAVNNEAPGKSSGTEGAGAQILTLP